MLILEEPVIFPHGEAAALPGTLEAQLALHDAPAASGTRANALALIKQFGFHLHILIARHQLGHLLLNAGQKFLRG